jgi:hypothetical protein
VRGGGQRWSSVRPFVAAALLAVRYTSNSRFPRRQGLRLGRPLLYYRVGHRRYRSPG